MRRTLKWFTFIPLALAGACADLRSPVDSAIDPVASGPSATIYDGAHAAYDSKFYFLPPMVKNPKDDKKDADGTLSPVVEVCELTAGGACGRLIDRYAATGGSQTNENVRWLGNHYHVNFHAGRYTLDTSKMLRVTVYVDGLTMGWADVIVGRSAKDFRGVDPEEYVTITSAQTLPIKFRIGHGIAAAIKVTPPLDSVRVGESTQYAAAVTDLHGNPLDVPVTWTSSDPTIATVDQNGVVTTYRPGTVTITASAERVSDSATLVVTTSTPVIGPPVRVEVDSVVIAIGNTVTLVARAYDANGNLVPNAGPYTWTVRDSDGNLVRITSETGEVKGLAAGTALATATLGGGASGSGTVRVTTDIELPVICSTDGLVHFGSTTILPDGPCGLRLTPASEWTAGSAWSTTKQPLAGGFEVRYGMRMSQPGPADLLVQGNTRPGADGLVFVIQNQGQNIVGNQGVGIGYQGMMSSLAIEFDTWLNPGEGDQSGNHVSVHTNGVGPNNAQESYSIGSADIPGDLYDNQVHEVVIRYTPGTLTVSLDGVVLVTASITLTNVGGASILDSDGQAWVGFTSATGGAYGIHDVMSWYLHTTP